MKTSLIAQIGPISNEMLYERREKNEKFLPFVKVAPMRAPRRERICKNGHCGCFPGI